MTNDERKAQLAGLTTRAVTIEQVNRDTRAERHRAEREFLEEMLAMVKPALPAIADMVDIGGKVGLAVSITDSLWITAEDTLFFRTVGRGDFRWSTIDDVIELGFERLVLDRIAGKLEVFARGNKQLRTEQARLRVGKLRAILLLLNG